MDNLLLRAANPISGLTVDLEFTKDTYKRGETVTVRATLTNTGTVPLHGIIANCNRAGFSYELEEGLTPAPTLPNCGGPIATPPPAPRPLARTAPNNNLADTGADIAGPAVVGALALLTGAGAVLATRRRRSAGEG